MFQDKKSLIYLIIIAVLVFFSGYFVGKICPLPFGSKSHCKSGGHKWGMHKNPAQYQKYFKQKLVKRLDLSDQQIVQLDGILGQHLEGFHQKHKEMKASVKPMFSAMSSDIEAILTPDQQAKYAKMKERMGKKRGCGPGACGPECDTCDKPSGSKY